MTRHTRYRRPVRWKSADYSWLGLPPPSDSWLLVWAVLSSVLLLPLCTARRLEQEQGNDTPVLKKAYNPWPTLVCFRSRSNVVQPNLDLRLLLHHFSQALLGALELFAYCTFRFPHDVSNIYHG
jgi:hypothetical protein